MLDPAAIYAFGTSAITAIAKEIATPDKLALMMGGGVIGNWAFSSLVTGLNGSRHAWECFQENCRRLDPR